MRDGRALNVPLARYRLRFRHEGGGSLPPYTGSAWRGALGHVLRATVCVTGLQQCEACLLYYSCPYAYVFETPPPPDSDRLRRYRAAPHPFVLRPQEVFAPSPADAATAAASGQDGYELGLILVGKAVRYLPYVVFSLSRAAARGIGHARVLFALERVDQEVVPGRREWVPIGDGNGPLHALPAVSPEPRPLPDRLRLRLLTPLRLVRDEVLVGPVAFRFSDLLRNLLRRASALHYFHGGTPLSEDFRGLADASETVEIKAKRLEWRDWTRYSTRQRTAMQMGGLIGEIEVAGRDVVPFWPYLQLGELVHAGKATSMGLGRYELEAVA